MTSSVDIAITSDLLEGPKSLYPGFSDWWNKVQSEQRDCYVLQDAQGYNVGIAVVDPRGPTKVKLCTFALTKSEAGSGRAFLAEVCRALCVSGYRHIYGTLPEGRMDLATFYVKSGFDVSPDGVLTRHINAREDLG